MAATFVGSAVATALNGGTATVTLPAGMQQDDIVVLCHSVAAQSAVALISGWTAMGLQSTQTGTGANTRSGRVSLKKMGAVPDTTVACPGTGTSTDGTCAVVEVWRGIDTTTQLDVAVLQGGAISGAPQAAAITPASDDCPILIFAYSENNDTTPGTVTNYTSPTPSTAATNDTNPLTSAVAHRLLSGGAGIVETPGAWSSWTSGRYSTFTVALRPAAGATQQFGSSTMPGSSDLSINGTQGNVAGAVYNGASALSVRANLGQQIAANFAGSGVLSVNAIRPPLLALVTLTGAGSFSADAQQFKVASAIMPGAGALSADASTWKFATVTMNGLGALSAYGNMRMLSAATLSGVGTLSIFATITGQATVWQAAVTFAGAGTLSAAVRVGAAGVATYAGAGSLSARVVMKNAASALYSGAGLLSAYVNMRARISARFLGTGSLSVLLTPIGLVHLAQAVFRGASYFEIDCSRVPAPPPFYDYPIGRGIFSDYGFRASKTLYKGRLVIGRR